MGDQAEYAGVKYESTQDENENHLPSQWPEYWQPANETVEFYYPVELQVLRIKSKVQFTNDGQIEEVKPLSFALVVPGNFTPTGFLKEIAWYGIVEISDQTSSNPRFTNIIRQIREHDFYAQMLAYDTIEAR